MSEDEAQARGKFFPVSWQELHRDAKALAWRLLELGPWEGVVAITRGGLVPAAIVARELEIRVIETVGVASYDYMDQGEPRVVKTPATDKGGEGWLIVLRPEDWDSVRPTLTPGADVAPAYEAKMAADGFDGCG